MSSVFTFKGLSSRMRSVSSSNLKMSSIYERRTISASRRPKWRSSMARLARNTLSATPS